MAMRRPVIAALILGLVFAGAAAAQPKPPEASPESAPPDASTPTPLDLIMANHFGEGACEDPSSEIMRQHHGVTAGVAPTVDVYVIPCSAGGGNVSYRLYSHEKGEIGGVETLYFATFSAKHGWTGTDLLYNVEVDGPKLKARFKAGPGGDCGTLAEWTWTDYAYRLDRFAAEETCSGRDPSQWKVIYPAE